MGIDEYMKKEITIPTSMTFIDNDTIMALEKDGNVRLISKGV